MREEARGASFKLAFQFAVQVSHMLQQRIKRGQSSRVEPKPESSRHPPPDIFDAKPSTVERGSVTFTYDTYIHTYIYLQPAAAFVVSYPRFTVRQSSIATFRPNHIWRISSRTQIKSDISENLHREVKFKAIFKVTQIFFKCNS